MLIGLTGTNAAGKGTIAKYLEKKSFYYESLSNILRAYLDKKGIPISRESLINEGNELRKLHGNYILAEILLNELNPINNYVIDSIRNPYEIAMLKETRDFFLMGVIAPPELRFERIKKRNRENDPKTLEDFLRLEEIENSENDYGQQIEKCISLTDGLILNDGGFDDLYKRIDIVLSDVSKRISFKRPIWDEYFIRVADNIALRSNCIKRRVGAVIVKNKDIISTGYNGTPPGIKNCYDGGCNRCNNFADSGTSLNECICAHAERNAIDFVARNGKGSTKGSMIYATLGPPCLDCTKSIIMAGIEEVIYKDEYPSKNTSVELLNESKVTLRRHLYSNSRDYNIAAIKYKLFDSQKEPTKWLITDSDR